MLVRQGYAVPGHRSTQRGRTGYRCSGRYSASGRAECARPVLPRTRAVLHQSSDLAGPILAPWVFVSSSSSRSFSTRRAVGRGSVCRVTGTIGARAPTHAYARVQRWPSRDNRGKLVGGAKKTCSLRGGGARGRERSRVHGSVRLESRGELPTLQGRAGRCWSRHGRVCRASRHVMPSARPSRGGLRPRGSAAMRIEVVPMLDGRVRRRKGGCQRRVQVVRQPIVHTRDSSRRRRRLRP